MKRLHILTLALLPFLCVGCLFFAVPVPTPGKHAAESQSARIADETSKFIRVGSTSKEEVLLRLGEPYLALREQTIFAYEWIMVPGYFFWFFTAAGHSQVVGEGYRFKNHYVLRIEFDEDDTVKGCEIEKKVSRETIIQSGDVQTTGVRRSGEQPPDHPCLFVEWVWEAPPDIQPTGVPEP